MLPHMPPLAAVQQGKKMFENLNINIIVICIIKAKTRRIHPVDASLVQVFLFTLALRGAFLVKMALLIPHIRLFSP
jgi:hypothetical protein